MAMAALVFSQLLPLYMSGATLNNLIISSVCVAALTASLCSTSAIQQPFTPLACSLQESSGVCAGASYRPLLCFEARHQEGGDAQGGGVLPQGGLG